MDEPVSVLDLLPAVAAEASEAETTDPEPSVKFAKSVDPLIDSEREYRSVKTPFPAMNAPAVGLESDIVGNWASETFEEETESSLESHSESRTSPGETERFEQVFEPSERFSTANVTVLHETDFAHVPDVESIRKHPVGDEIFEESKSDNAVESGFENVTEIPVPLVKAAETNCG